jgi:hypothetical protein
MVGYGISLAEAAKRLQVDQATVLSGLRTGALLDYQVRQSRSQALR